MLYIYTTICSNHSPAQLSQTIASQQRLYLSSSLLVLAPRPRVNFGGHGSASPSHMRGLVGMRPEEGSLYKVSDMINVD